MKLYDELYIHFHFLNRMSEPTDPPKEKESEKDPKMESENTEKGDGVITSLDNLSELYELASEMKDSVIPLGKDRGKCIIESTTVTPALVQKLQTILNQIAAYQWNIQLCFDSSNPQTIEIHSKRVLDLRLCPFPTCLIFSRSKN